MPNGSLSCYNGNRIDTIDKPEANKASYMNFVIGHGSKRPGVWSINEDKIGNLWFGTNGAGVFCYDGNRVEAIESGENIQGLGN